MERKAEKFCKKNTGVPEGALFLWENAGEERNLSLIHI